MGKCEACFMLFKLFRSLIKFHRLKLFNHSGQPAETDQSNIPASEEVFNLLLNYGKWVELLKLTSSGPGGTEGI